jgi:HK97 family phage major capsid protein
MSMKNIRELTAKKQAAVAAMRTSMEAADKEGRAPTAEEQAAYDGHKAEAGRLASAIERAQEALEIEANSPVANLNFRDDAVITVDENILKSPTGGFSSFGELAQKIRAASAPGGAHRLDPRLAVRWSRDGLSAAAPSTFGNEAAGQDGGFAVPPQYASEIFTLSNSLGEGALLPLCDEVPIDSNSMAFPKDETTPWGTDGVRAYWQAEAIAGTQTKPKLGLAELRMKKMLALVPVTDELLDDASALASYLPGKLAVSIRWKTNEAILFGTGAGQPQGAFNSNALITVAKESGQATQTLLPQNVAKMIARLPAGSFPNAVWLINNDVLPALFTLTLGNYPIYLPGGAQNVGGIQMNPYGTLLGRPIIVSQHAKSFSSQGDVLLADLSYYRAITKKGGVQMASSMHLYFDADATAFRATFRMDGQSKILNSITPANGSANMSPYVQLGAR